MRIVGKIVNRKELLKWGYIGFVEKEADIKLSGRSKTLKITRGAIEAPDGANVLPYFLSDRNKYYIVLIAQFRNAVGAVTWEAPGGVVGPGGIKKSMARELEQEAGIKINPKNIKIVFKEYFLPSLVNAFGWGGIVEIKESDLPSSRIHGEVREEEFTLLIIRSLSEIIKMRQGQQIVLDLWTSRLIDEVARTVGAPVLPWRQE